MKLWEVSSSIWTGAYTSKVTFVPVDLPQTLMLENGCCRSRAGNTNILLKRSCEDTSESMQRAVVWSPWKISWQRHGTLWMTCHRKKSGVLPGWIGWPRQFGSGIGWDNKTELINKNIKTRLLMERRLLSVEETATYLGLSPRTIYNQVHRKTKNPFPVKPKRFGKLVKFDKRDLDKYIDSL